MHVIKDTGKSLSELAADVKTYPQKLINVKVSDKKAALNNEKVSAVIKKVEQDMNGDGRVLVRPSGTEPLLRVMTEAPTKELVDKYTNEIADVVKAEVGIE